MCWSFEALAHPMTLQTLFGGGREPIWPALFFLPVHVLGDQSALAIRFIGVMGFVILLSLSSSSPVSCSGEPGLASLPWLDGVRAIGTLLRLRLTPSEIYSVFRLIAYVTADGRTDCAASIRS